MSHDGSLDAHKAKKAGRNKRLLMLALGEAPDDPYLHYQLKKLGRFEAGLALADVEMPCWQGSPDYFFTLGDLLLDFAVASPARGAELLPMIEASSWLRAIEIGEQPQLNDTVAGRGSFLAAHNLAVLYDSQGDAAEASRWRERARSGVGTVGEGRVGAIASAG